MENISRIKEKCVGCKSCEQSCPKHCISMEENKEGFWYPVVDEKNCVECGKCLKTCPVENAEQHRNTPQTVWAWRNKNDVDLMKSASGGAADSAAKAVLQMGGVVYGAAYDEQLVVSHIEIESNVRREKVQSSKYVQSDPNNSYSKVKQRLAEGKKVLYTGTPCQIAGLYAFFGGDKPNLYTVDIKAIKLMKEKLNHKNNVKFYVFSDDIEWCKSHIPVGGGMGIYVSQNMPVYETLRLMYTCKHFVLSNSTFSWWGQFLSTADNKIVVSPCGVEKQDAYRQSGWVLEGD